MALFQPFKKTPGRPTPKFMEAAIAQGQLDQQEQAQKNQARNAMYGGATDLGVGLYGEYKDKDSPIGNYLRNMGGGDAEVDPTLADPRLEETNAPLQSPTDYSGQADYMGTESAPTSLGAIQGDMSVAPPSGAPAPPSGDMFAPTEYAPPAELGLGGAEMGAEMGADTGEAAADDSIRGVLESLFSGGGDAALEQGGEQVAEAATEKAAEKAGAGFTPGLGSVMSLAQGDVKGAAAKYALSMLPPPYNLLAMFV